MNTHVERFTHTRFFGLALFSTASTWLNAKMKAHRARRIEKDAIEYLRSMDPSLLDDIGVDARQLYKPHATLAQFSPHVIATRVVGQAPSSQSAEQRQPQYPPR